MLRQGRQYTILQPNDDKLQRQQRQKANYENETDRTGHKDKGDKDIT